MQDIVVSPYEDGKYGVLKKRLIDEYSQTNNQKLQKLLQQLQLGDKKPSQLLQEMKNYSNNSVTNDFLKTLWLSRLPQAVKQILSASKDELDDLAKVADKIWESTNESCVSAVKIGSSTESDPLTSAVRLLTEKLEQFTKRMSDNPSANSFSRSSTPFRGRSRSRGRQSNSNNGSHTSNNNNDDELCWYHKKFGDNATKCKSPCKKSKN